MTHHLKEKRWLLQTYAFYPPLDKVVDMYKPQASNCLLKRDAFVFTFRGWNEPRGASGDILVKPRLATDAWIDHKLHRERIRMRPDRRFRCSRKTARSSRTSTSNPGAEGDGDVRPFLEFLARLLPDNPGQTELSPLQTCRRNLAVDL